MVKVQVEQGWLEGEQLDLVSGDGKFFSFKGIPYAAPPVGKLRFKDPQPRASWQGVRKATDHGPKCPQRDIFTMEIIPGSEDCLYLNVYTKEVSPKSHLPVMVFIHGGGFKSGSGCDTTSSFNGRGKKKAFKAWKAYPNVTKGFQSLYEGDLEKADPDIQKFVITMYDRNPTPDSSLGLNWPEYDLKNQSFVDISDKLTIGNHLDSEAVQFWASIYADADIGY